MSAVYGGIQVQFTVVKLLNTGAAYSIILWDSGSVCRRYSAT